MGRDLTEDAVFARRRSGGGVGGEALGPPARLRGLDGRVRNGRLVVQSARVWRSAGRLLRGGVFELGRQRGGLCGVLEARVGEVVV